MSPSLALVLSLTAGGAQAGTEAPPIQRPSEVARTTTIVRPTRPAPPPPPAEAASREPARRAPILHRGFVLEAKGGAMGCLGAVCRQAHRASPGPRLGGFIGGNIRGVLEIGAQAAYGILHPDPGRDADLPGLFGLDGAELAQAMPAGAPVALASIGVDSARLRSTHAGFALRLHVLPRGRVHLFAGIGAGYELLRADYGTALGQLRADFHGLGVPAHGGLSVYVARHLALGVEAEYRWTHYGVGHLSLSGQELTVPVSVLKDLGAGQLPRFWSASASARVRF